MTDQRHERPGLASSARTEVGPEPTVSPEVAIGTMARRRIGRDLRLLYASVLEQPLPERFTRLIDELAAGSSNREGSE